MWTAQQSAPADRWRELWSMAGHSIQEHKRSERMICKKNMTPTSRALQWTGFTTAYSTCLNTIHLWHTC